MFIFIEGRRMIAVHYYWFSILAALLLVVLLLVVFLRSSKRVTDLHKKAVLITGCDSGFGFNLACRLDQMGMKVFAGCLHPDGPGAKNLKSVCSDALQVLHMDVTRDDHIQEAVHLVSNSLEGKVLWGIVNNAGIATVGCLEWMSPEVVQRLFNVNALGPFRVTKAFLPYLRKSKGRIVIVASLGGVYPLQGAPAYSMSKHAAVSLAHSLRRELAQFKISVHLVNPASYRTPILSFPIVEELKSHWKILPEEVRSAYDEQSIYNFESIYVPGFLAKIQYLLLCITPIKLADHFLDFCLQIHKNYKRTLIDERPEHKMLTYWQFFLALCLQSLRLPSRHTHDKTLTKDTGQYKRIKFIKKTDQQNNEGTRV
ncbi:hypothetical protein C0J52_23593 [Blattella germanica]|nr:hypothetical protein C0J52_23593 [Blattella germanica]